MGLLGTARGRGKSAAPDLDQLLALPKVVPTLWTAANLRPTGVGSVCVRPVEKGPYEGPADYEESTDSFGFTWLTRRTSPEEIAGLINDLHTANASLVAAGLGAALLCTLVVFSDTREQKVGLIYLPKRGSWYPFVPTGSEKRDNPRELAIKQQLGNNLKVEQDLTRWAPLWGAPGL